MEQKEHGRLEDSLQEETTDQENTDQEDLNNTEYPADLNSFGEPESQEQ